MFRLSGFLLVFNLLLPAFLSAQNRLTDDPWAAAQELTRRGQYIQAIPLLQKAAADTANLPAALQLAYAHQRTGAWAAAKRQYESLLQRRPNLPEALNQLAVLSEREANYGKALGFYRRLLALDTTDAYFLKQVGAMHAKLSQPTLAMRFFGKAVKAAPDDLEALGELATLYLNDGKKDKLAEPLISRGLKLDPTSVKFLQLDSRLSYRIGNFKDVVEDIEKTMALGDTASYYQRLLGTAYYQIDSLTKSVRTFQRLLKLGEDTEPVHAGLATAFLLGMKPLPKDSIGKVFRIGEAQSHFRQAIERGTSSKIPNYLLGHAEAMEKDGMPTEVVARQYRLVYENHQRPKALYRLGLLHEAKDPELAAIYYREFLDVCKDPKKATRGGTDCLLAGTVQARLQGLKKQPGTKAKPAPTEPAVAKDTATAAPDTTNREEK
jgi:tetratricopeptide (TPR) repeat protein